MVSRLNDAILITRELVKQRWSPMVVLSMGPGWYEDQYLKTLGKLSDGPMSFVPWYDPNKKLSKQLEAALAKTYPGINMNTNHVFTFEALLVAADAYKRARSTDPKALADAIRMIGDREKPLVLYLFSRDKRVTREVMAKTSAGGTVINDTLVHFYQTNLPFGGVGNSGMGKAHGFFGFEAFSNARGVLEQPTRFSSIQLLYPPYTKLKRKLIDFTVRWL